MRKFIINSLIFLFFGVLSLQLVSELLIISGLYLAYLPGETIYYSISKSKKKQQSKKLLLGDSVGRQLFPNTANNDGINSLACNRSIGMTGQYILLHNYLKAGNDIDTLYMIFTPFSFTDNLDQKFTFHYFLKPFYNSEYKPLFTKKVNQQIKKIPYHQFIWLPHLRATSWAPEFKTTGNNKEYKLISPISREYLKKIKALSSEYSFKIILLPTPTSIKKKDSISSLIDPVEFKRCNMDKEFKEYFNKIIYLKNSKFIDNNHLKTPVKYSDLYKEKWVK